ncbi:MAG: B12-binding domain-containing radical SAM protein [bacterium]
MMTRKRHKILLYNPEAVFYTMPLGLLAVGSVLDPQEYEVVIIDGRLEKNVEEVILCHLHEALCLGITVLTGQPIRDALRISRLVKQHHPEVPVIWGGWHPSLFPMQCLEEYSVDVVVSGQGEVTFAQLIEKLADDQTLSDIQGITYRNNAVPTQNASRPLINMNDLPEHNFELIPVERYFKLKGQRQLDYISSTGCHFRCAFCADPFIYNRKWTALAPERMGREIASLWHKYRFENLAFQDETFFTYKKRVAEIAEEFLHRQLRFTWTGTLRADQGYRLDNETLALCKKSGLRRVMIGVESGSQEILNWLQKDITVAQVFDSAEKCLRHGIAAIFPFIVGFPDEPEESVVATMNLIKQLRAMSPDFETVIFFYQPYPGSPIAEMVKENGHPILRTLEEWADFDYVGSYGPWVSRTKWRNVQRFKFYSRFAWSRNGTPWHWALKKLAHWRCERDFYQFPMEKVVLEYFRPPEKLS